MRHIFAMKQKRPPELEMTLEGDFVSQPKPPVSTRILFWAVVVAVLAGALSLAALALWVAMIILPVAIGAIRCGGPARHSAASGMSGTPAAVVSPNSRASSV
jgi:hypothetical protein